MTGIIESRGRSTNLVRPESRHQHAASPARVITTLPDGGLRVEIYDDFADYDSVDASCLD